MLEKINFDDYQERDDKTWNDPLADEFIRQLSSDNVNLLREWAGSSFQFNEPARAGKTTPKIEQLVKIIDSSEVPDHVRMFRVTSPSTLDVYRMKGKLFNEGEIIKMDGFTSASATKKAINETRDSFKNAGRNVNVEIELFVPKGTKAIPLSKASRDLKYEFQKEWLFQRDTEVQVLEKRFQNGRVILKLLVLNRQEETK